MVAQNGHICYTEFNKLMEVSMENKTATMPQGLFQTSLVFAALVSCVLAVFAGIPPLVALADPEYQKHLMQKLIEGGIIERSAVITWSVIQAGISLLCVICPGFLAGGLAAALRGKQARGFGFLSDSAEWLVRIWSGMGIVLAAAYVIRAVLYVAASVQSPQAVMLIYSMVMMEGMMGVLAWFVFCGVRSFARGLGDAFASMAYTLSSGRLDDVSIPASAERGFLVLGILCPAWAVKQVVTVTIVVTQFRSYYGIVYASHPMEYLMAASLVCNGAASILMWLYLRRYNRICEWEKYQAGKKT